MHVRVWTRGFVCGHAIARLPGCGGPARQYLEIDPLQRTVAAKGHALLLGRHKWRGGALCAYGNVHCVPAEATCVLRIDPKSGLWTTFGDLRGAGDGAKWSGGCLSAFDDRIYGVR